MFVNFGMLIWVNDIGFNKQFCDEVYLWLLPLKFSPSYTVRPNPSGM